MLFCLSCLVLFTGKISAYMPFSRLQTRVSHFGQKIAALRAETTDGSVDYDTLIENVKKTTPKGSVIVVKYGGHAMENEELKRYFCEDIAALCRVSFRETTDFYSWSNTCRFNSRACLVPFASQIGILPVIVHGGGPQIANMLKKLEIESKFLQGLRVTDAKTMEVAQMVLCGSINKDIAGMISAQPGVRGAIGLCGLDGKLIQAKAMVKTAIDEVTGKEIQLDLGLVGDPTIVNTQLLKDLLGLSLVPVCAPVGCNEVGGGSLNINADTAAGNVAEALKVSGVLSSLVLLSSTLFCPRRLLSFLFFPCPLLSTIDLILCD